MNHDLYYKEPSWNYGDTIQPERMISIRDTRKCRLSGLANFASATRQDNGTKILTHVSRIFRRDKSGSYSAHYSLRSQS